MKKLSTAVLLTVFSMLTVVSLNASQAPLKRIIHVKPEPAWTEPPLKITEIRVGDKKVEDGRYFEANDEWLKDLSVTVQNVSDEPILGFTLAVKFLKDDAGNIPVSDLYLMTGRDYIYSEKGVGEALKFLPGNFATASVTQDRFDNVMMHIKHMPNVPGGILNFVDLHIKSVSFEPNHVWMDGYDLIRDPNNPTVLLPSEKMKHRSAQHSNEVKQTLLMKKVSFNSKLDPANCKVLVRYDRISCIQPGCTNCIYVKPVLRDTNLYETGYTTNNQSAGCQREQNGIWYACTGCCYTVEMVTIQECVNTG